MLGVTGPASATMTTTGLRARASGPSACSGRLPSPQPSHRYSNESWPGATVETSARERRSNSAAASPASPAQSSTSVAAASAHSSPERNCSAARSNLARVQTLVHDLLGVVHLGLSLRSRASPAHSRALLATPPPAPHSRTRERPRRRTPSRSPPPRRSPPPPGSAPAPAPHPDAGSRSARSA